MSRLGKIWAGLIIVGGMVSPVLAQDPPASKLNPLTGNIEIADSVWTGGGFDVRYVVNPPLSSPGAGPEVTDLSSAPEDDRAPAMALTSDAGSHVVWWRDAAFDLIVHRERLSDGTWTAEAILSRPDENASEPDIALLGDQAWIAYEVRDPYGARAACAQPINDEPDPFGTRMQFAPATRSASLDVRIRSEQGRLWVTWIDSDFELGWSRWDATVEDWTPAQYRDHMASGIPATLIAIRDEVLNE